MTKNIFKKSVVIGIIILFLGASILPTISGKIDNNNIKINTKQTSTLGLPIYVNNTYPPGGDGTIDWPYCEIQTAVDKAITYDTIIVQVGTGVYNENVIINKSDITLQGEKIDAIAIDGGGLGSVIQIPHYSQGNYNNIKITNFVIQNGIPAGIEVGYVGLDPDTGVEISYCRIRNNAFGIHTWHTSYDDIHNNIIQDNFWGILMEFADHSKIETNIIDNNRAYGIIADTSDILTITDNEMSNNNIGLCIVREVDLYQKNSITANNFISNTYHATFKDAKNYWNANYWENPPPTFPNIGINIIKGVRTIPLIGIEFPWGEFDWHCAKSGYTINPW